MSPAERKLRVLFLCTGNSCRSQMAEGWARHLLGDIVEPLSAGTHPTTIDPIAIQVMGEAGIDISSQFSKPIDDFSDTELDMVVTVCDAARTNCPLFAGGVAQLHRGFDDPAQLARESIDKTEIIDIYRRVRDEIKSVILPLLKENT